MACTELDWLGVLKADLAARTGEAAKRFWPSPVRDWPAFYNYRLQHVRQVERDAGSLLDAVGGDRDVVLASVWLHDALQPAFSGGPRHGQAAAEWAAGHLAALGFPEEKVEVVCHAVSVHSGDPGTIPPGKHEARLLWDADKLAHLGPLDVFVVLLNNLAVDRLSSLDDNDAFPDRVFTIEGFAGGWLAQFLERESPADRFYFAVSRAWAAERFAAERALCRALCRQVGADGRG